MEMKFHTSPLIIVLLFTLVVCGCGSDDEKTDLNKIHREKLVKTWTLVSVTLDEEDPGQILDSFTITVGSTSATGPYSYAVTGTEFPSPWKSSGTWTITATSETAGQIHRDDDVDIAYEFKTDGKLQLIFTYQGDGYEGARSKSVGGEWDFILE